MDLGHGTGWVVFSEHYLIAFRPEPMRVEIDEPIALILNVCTRSGDAADLTGVDAQLLEDDKEPRQHLTIVPGGDGHYRAEGLVIPRTGHWEIAFDVRSGGEREELTHEIIVK
jgi:hypothetical protein